MPRGLTALVLTAALLSALAPAASAADFGLQVRVDDRDAVRYDLDALSSAQDVSAKITRRGPNADSSPLYVGPSAKGLLDLVGEPVEHVVKMVVTTPLRGTERAVTIAKDRIIAGYTSPTDGLRFATFGLNYGTGVEFVRPIDETDGENANDCFGPDNPYQDVDVQIVTDGVPALEVQATAEPPDAVKVGQPVHFEPTVSGGGPNLRYRWNFGDGGAASTRAPNYTFKTAGSWVPKVQVTDRDSGAIGIFTFKQAIVVTEDAEPTSTPTTSPTATPGGADTGGPGGQGAGGGNAPTGARAGKRNAATNGAKRSSSRRESRAGGKRSAQATPIATATAAAIATPTSVASGSGEGNAGGRAKPGESEQDHGKAASSAPTPGATTAPETAAPKGAATNAPRGEQVDGILLASAGTIADVIDAARSAEQAKQDRAQARRGGGDSAPIAGWVGGGAGLFGLLLLGMVREGGFRRWRPPPSPA